MRFSDVSRALAQPVRYHLLIHYLVRIGLVVIALRYVPILVSWLNESRGILISQIIVSALLLTVLIPLLRIPAPEDIRDNEVMVITVLSFFLSALTDGIPFMTEGLSAIDALFEAVSGVTTTGLSTVSNLQQHSTGFLFARAWMQWYGGLGIVVFSIALLFLNKGIAARKLTMGDIGDSRDILGNARLHSLNLLFIYSSLTAFAIYMLLIAGVSPFNAVTYALSGVSTGGFSIYDNSLAAIPRWFIQFLIMLCGLMGAISLPFYYRLIRNGVQELLFNPEIRALLILCIVITGLLFFFSGENSADVGSRSKSAVILALSAQTTTGFTNVDVAALNNPSKLSIIFSMAIGGSIGSTAGGLKILRLLIVLRLMQFFILRTALPAHAVLERQLGGDKLEFEDIERVLVLVMIFVATVLASWLPFLMAGYPPLDALFEVVSACTTTGLSTGITRAELEMGLKIVLIFDMLLGRVEFLAFWVVLYPRTWIKVGSQH